jgi:hypothetical protein
VLGQVVNQARKEANGEADAEPDPHYGAEPFTVERAVEAMPDAVYLMFRSRRQWRNPSATAVFEAGPNVLRMSCHQPGFTQGAASEGRWWWGHLRSDARSGIARFGLPVSGASVVLP